MRLRTILTILTLLAALSCLVGGYFYTANVRLSLESRAAQQANNKITDIKGRFTAFLAEQLKPVRTLAGLTEIRRGIEIPSPDKLQEVNSILDLFQTTLDADVCYLLDDEGMTIASSNRLEADSFVGRDFSFRPYFQKAIRGTSSIYMALGTTSKKRGVYYSFPIVDHKNQQPRGIAVIKASVEYIESQFANAADSDEMLFLTDPHGIIFITSRSEWLFHSLWALKPEAKETIVDSKQFGEGGWPWLGLRRAEADHRVLDREGRHYMFYEQDVDLFPGWKTVYLRQVPGVSSILSAQLRHPSGVFILVFFLFVGISVMLLYQKARSEILQRREAEQALKESESRYRQLYLNTPALLHSIDPTGKLVSVSDYWTEILGYSREEVVGRRVTDFMAPASREMAENVVIPNFLRTGVCKNIPYQLVKKNGELIDVLLSAIAEYDKEGSIRRSLAILVDVTELKRTEQKLKEATLELRRYSKDLEKQVRKRANEMSNILRYTPAVVSLKDTEGRYQLVNSRFEDLFNLRFEAIRGRKDQEIFDAATAESVVASDRKVMKNKESLKVEERLQLADGEHVYLSVKFPLFDDSQQVVGIGNIATDITDLKKAQNQLRKLSSSIVQSQERERAAIARELHDELGQALTALRMDAVWLENKLGGKDEAPAERAKAMSVLIDKTIDEVRNMAVRLRPGVLDDLGLLAALEWLVDDLEKRLAIPCTFKYYDTPELGPMTATAVYRITQEALTNVARHADAGKVEVVLRLEGDMVVLIIEDDGRGFADEHPGEGEGLGLAGIRERASLIDAEVSIESSAEKGSRIELRFPLVHFHDGTGAQTPPKPKSV